MGACFLDPHGGGHRSLMLLFRGPYVRTVPRGKRIFYRSVPEGRQHRFFSVRTDHVTHLPPEHGSGATNPSTNCGIPSLEERTVRDVCASSPRGASPDRRAKFIRLPMIRNMPWKFYSAVLHTDHYYSTLKIREESISSLACGNPPECYCGRGSADNLPASSPMFALFCYTRYPYSRRIP